MVKLIVHIEHDTANKAELTEAIDVALGRLPVRERAGWRFFDSLDEATEWEEGRLHQSAPGNESPPK